MWPFDETESTGQSDGPGQELQVVTLLVVLLCSFHPTLPASAGHPVAADHGGGGHQAHQQRSGGLIRPLTDVAPSSSGPSHRAALSLAKGAPEGESFAPGSRILGVPALQVPPRNLSRVLPPQLAGAAGCGKALPPPPCRSFWAFCCHPRRQVHLKISGNAALV